MHERCRQVRSRRRKYASHYHVTPFISSVFRNALACSATALHTNTHYSEPYIFTIWLSPNTHGNSLSPLFFSHTILLDFIPYCHTCQASAPIFALKQAIPSYPPPSVPTIHTPFHTLSPPFHTNNFFLPPFHPIFAPYSFFRRRFAGFKKEIVPL